MSNLLAHYQPEMTNKESFVLQDVPAAEKSTFRVIKIDVKVWEVDQIIAEMRRATRRR